MQAKAPSEYPDVKSYEDDDEDDYEDLSDDTSLSSIFSVFSSSSISSSESTEELEGAAKELARLLLEDKILMPLFDAVPNRVMTDKFERNFARLLNVFAIDLGAEARSAPEKIAAQFVSRSKQGASIPEDG